MQDQESINREAYRRAERRIEDRIGFFWHLIVYLIVNGGIVLIWYFTTGADSYFWPKWSLLGWGIGLLFHFVSVFLGEGVFRGYKDRKIAQYIEEEKRHAEKFMGE